ncbi:MAG: type III-A CRISPR-associated RAMP protein Csm4 [Candidatus Omnitrophica bacterium]|nr:type III-A CRISPR-associated RAMP protein Csm4 [Candidatus Omnitrophota bacterium]
MKVFQIILSTQSAISSLLQADTLFGHLCWLVKYFEGEEELARFLAPFTEGNPPFLISDGFPFNSLPKPFITDFNILNKEEEKLIKSREWVTPRDFEKIRRAQKIESLDDIKEEENFLYCLTTHNTINRSDNSTLQQKGIYSNTELFIDEISFYIKVTDKQWLNRVIDLFNKLSVFGYGRKRSIGKGRFKIKNVQEFFWEDVEGANGFVTLSNFCPSENDPTEGVYKIFIKYGKLGSEFTFCGNPFKRPLLMLKTGSVFKTESHPKQYYGKMVKGVSPIKKEVVHYAYAFAVPIKYPF